MVVQDETGALVLAAFTPGDVERDGTVSASIIASFAHPGHPSRHTHAWALGAASHIAAFDRPTAELLAAWLETTASFAERAEELGAAEAAASLVEPACRFARHYLRADGAG